MSVPTVIRRSKLVFDQAFHEGLASAGATTSGLAIRKRATVSDNLKAEFLGNSAEYLDDIMLACRGVYKGPEVQGSSLSMRLDLRAVRARRDFRRELRELGLEQGPDRWRYSSMI
jgi:hypothetical protein